MKWGYINKDVLSKYETLFLGNFVSKILLWLNNFENIEEFTFNNITTIPDELLQMDNLKALLINVDDINIEHLNVFQEILDLNAAIEYDGDDADEVESHRFNI